MWRRSRKKKTVCRSNAEVEQEVRDYKSQLKQVARSTEVNARKLNKTFEKNHITLRLYVAMGGK